MPRVPVACAYSYLGAAGHLEVDFDAVASYAASTFAVIEEEFVVGLEADHLAWHPVAVDVEPSFAAAFAAEYLAGLARGRQRRASVDGARGPDRLAVADRPAAVGPAACRRLEAAERQPN